MIPVRPHLPPLYDPSFEHDACGVGFIADVRGRRSHRIVQLGVQAVCRLAHRGAVDADEQTGDGAGITIQVPTAYFREEFERTTGIRVGTAHVGVGMFFLPRRNSPPYNAFKSLIEDVLLRRGLTRFIWRDVPIDTRALGGTALSTRPDIQQLVVIVPNAASELDVDRRLYLARREMESRVSQSVHSGLYVCSFSCRTLVYKGLMNSPALAEFFSDLRNPAFESAFAVFHQRYSTNTFPNWQLAHPFRMLAHNGEINTIQGNRNWTRARESELSSPVWGADARFLQPILQDGGSDSANIDNAAELLALSGRSIVHAMAMLVPDAWKAATEADDEVRAFYEYHSCLNEAWDGPAALVFADGDWVGAMLDRNGLRPSRYKLTSDGLLVLGSEFGVIDLPDESVTARGRLGPGHVLAVDLRNGRVVTGQEIKAELAARRPWGDWVVNNLERIPVLPVRVSSDDTAHAEPIARMQLAFGYSEEEVKFVFQPMALDGKEPVGSMGDDTPLAILSDRPRLLASYFKQRFAQVTNPPIDSLREHAVMSLDSNLGRRRNWLEESPDHARQLTLAGPVISDAELEHIRARTGSRVCQTFSLLFSAAGGPEAMLQRLEEICSEAERAADDGCEIVVLSDRGITARRAPIPILLAVGAVNSHLLRVGKRLRLSLVADSGEPREVHHFATLIGYGAGAINPWLAWRTIAGEYSGADPIRERLPDLLENYRHAVHAGLMKVMAKMGISMIGSYRGAQIFESIGISRRVINRCFTGTPSHVGGLGLLDIAHETLLRHSLAFQDSTTPALEDHGYYRFRRGGERHAWSPDALRAMGSFRKAPTPENYAAFARAANDHPPITLRDLLEFRSTSQSVPVEEVESIEEIRRRFTTAGMSLGALSPETHEAIAIAMNRIGGKSNSGEGGEDAARAERRANGDVASSAIRQIASGRFGVTPEYLIRATELEIKMAQGSKPGEGGQLPGNKVTALIATLRHAVPGIQLISPPPHHDIYSIEDLAQLIYDIKEINPDARVCVKLVAEAGVGTIAAGVAKAFADTILVSGHDGGTGASPLSSIKNAGSAWELGLAEAQQVLMLNGLRERVVLRTDGGLKTGRDIVVAAMLGAEEFNFGTAALIALGCRYVRQCHLNTCPVGIATQDPKLRERFDGGPEMLIAYLDAVARDVREILASLGFRTLREIVGRADLLQQVRCDPASKASRLRLGNLLASQFDSRGARYNTWPRNGTPPRSLNDTIVEQARGAIETSSPIELEFPIHNTDRTVGARVAGLIARLYTDRGLPPRTIRLRFRGSAGQSFGAFCIEGMALDLAGEANDYVGKSMAGGEIVVRVPPGAPFRQGDVILGNTCLYGATGGALFAQGSAGERFCVRNSGATAVVEGVGDHGCEYMTGGAVVVLGKTGRNFAAGMTGGVAWVWDPGLRLPPRCNLDLVVMERLEPDADDSELQSLVALHAMRTGSARAQRILEDWPSERSSFWRVLPKSVVARRNAPAGTSAPAA